MSVRGFGARGDRSPLEAAKARARAAKEAFDRALAARQPVTCGMGLLKYISPEIDRMAREFNEAWAEVVRLDPSLPEHMRDYRL